MGVIGTGDRACSLAELAAEPHDLIVVGGGIYGAMAHLEAARRGLRSVLVERADFGGATSFNSLRILHGGLRYLQSLDVPQSVESTRERQWYLEHMPELVEPLPCLLPLYGRGLKRASVLRLGLRLNAYVAAAALRERTAAALHPGRVLSHAETLECWPLAPRAGLEGAAQWFDLKMRCPPRVVIDALRAAAALGGVAANYASAEGLLVAAGRVCGVAVCDGRSGTGHELVAPLVINAGGPWAAELCARFGQAAPEWTPATVAWNVSFDRPALATHAIALQAATVGGLLFATSLAGKMLVGTGYAPLGRDELDSARAIADAHLDRFIDTINGCVPELALGRRDVVQLYVGVLPAQAAGSAVPRSRNALRDHGRTGGPRGLFSVSGTKFTTARSAARVLVAAALDSSERRRPAAAARAHPQLVGHAADTLLPSDWQPATAPSTWRSGLERVIAEEAVEHLEDLVLRRTTLGDDPAHALAVAPLLCGLHPRWQGERSRELERLAANLAPPLAASSARTQPRLAGGVTTRR